MVDAPAVLVVDDNGENRALAEATLDDASDRVAIAMFGRVSPRCVLVDVRMPVIDTCRAIRRQPGGNAVAVILETLKATAGSEILEISTRTSQNRLHEYADAPLPGIADVVGKVE